jgi:hypothetical protein
MEVTSASWQLVFKPFCCYLPYVPILKIWKPQKIVGISATNMGMFFFWEYSELVHPYIMRGSQQ